MISSWEARQERERDGKATLLSHYAVYSDKVAEGHDIWKVSILPAARVIVDLRMAEGLIIGRRMPPLNSKDESRALAPYLFL